MATSCPEAMEGSGLREQMGRSGDLALLQVGIMGSESWDVEFLGWSNLINVSWVFPSVSKI